MTPAVEKAMARLLLNRLGALEYKTLDLNVDIRILTTYFDIPLPIWLRDKPETPS